MWLTLHLWQSPIIRTKPYIFFLLSVKNTDPLEVILNYHMYSLNRVWCWKLAQKHKSSVNWPRCHFTATHSPWRHLTAICPQFFSQIRPESHKAAVVNFPRKLSQGDWKGGPTKSYHDFLSNEIRSFGCIEFLKMTAGVQADFLELSQPQKRGGATSRLEGCDDISVAEL